MLSARTGLVLGVLLLLALPGSVSAREDVQKPPRAPITLDDLYARLKTAEDPEAAKGIAGLIARRLARSGIATVDLLTERAGEAMNGDDVPLAVELMDRALTIDPNWAEGWSRRATLFWRLQDRTSAIADLERALVLEPRHFEAWAALGKLFLASDDKQHALDAFRRAEAIYPKWEILGKAIDRLSPEVDGREL